MSDWTTGDGLCARCGSDMTGITGVGHEQRYPDPGDVTICIYCGQWYEVTDDAGAVEPRTRAEVLAACAGDRAQVMRLMAAELAVRRFRQGKEPA